MCACARCCWTGWARYGAPHRSFARFVLLLRSATSGLGCPFLVLFLDFFLFFVAFFTFLSLCPPVSRFLWFRAPGVLGLGAVWPIPLPCFLSRSRRGLFWFFPPSALLFFFPPPFFFLLLLFFRFQRLSLPPHPPLFVLWVSRCSALCVPPLLFCFQPGLWLSPCSCCPPWYWFYACRCCCSVFCAFPLPFCSCLLGCRSLEVLAARFPPLLVCALCLAISGVAVLCRPSVCCFASPCCLVLCRVLFCGASPCFGLGCCALCGVLWCSFLCVVPCCWLLLRVVPCL